MFPIYTYAAIYFVTILFGILSYKKYSQNLQLKLFIYFLTYSFFTEITETIFTYYFIINTAFIYNSWNIVSFIFYAFFFISKISSQTKKVFVKSFVLIFCVLFLINALFFQSFQIDVFIYNNILGKTLMIIIIMMYYTELLKSDLILTINKSMFFWVSLGVLAYSIGFIPVFVIAEYILYRGMFTYITFVLNILMSLSFMMGILLSEKRYNN